MNTTLWIIQIFLCIVMLALGVMKTFYPVEKLSNLSWTTRSSEQFIRFVGISELLIAAGLIIPQFTGILPILTTWAAASLCLIMLFAIVDHVKHKEASEIWKNVIVISLAAFVAMGRLAM